jgi:hypothetical protein
MVVFCITPILKFPSGRSYILSTKLEPSVGNLNVDLWGVTSTSMPTMGPGGVACCVLDVQP